MEENQLDDDYTHYDSSIFYVEENILGPVENTSLYEDLQKSFDSQLTNHCECDSKCTIGTCDCIKQSLTNNESHNKEGEQSYQKEHSYPILECNSLCHCSSACANRVVQRGPIHSLLILQCDKGLGLFTSTFIANGTFICEYAGELITKIEASTRHKRNQQQGNMNYIFCLKEHCDGRTIDVFVDPSQFGNIGRYINHSCTPNCHILPVRVNCPIPKLAIFALTDIPPGEEITFHYGSDSSETLGEAPSLVKCLCKSKNCNGFMPFQYY